MKVYLSARYGRLPEMQRYADQLIRAGHLVVSTWHSDEHEHEDDTGTSEPDPACSEEFALQDVMDIERATAFVAFTERSDSPHGRGGRHVEFGYAACMEPAPVLMIVGPRENVFHHLPGVRRYVDWWSACCDLCPEVAFERARLEPVASAEAVGRIVERARESVGLARAGLSWPAGKDEWWIELVEKGRILPTPSDLVKLTDLIRNARRTKPQHKGGFS